MAPDDRLLARVQPGARLVRAACCATCARIRRSSAASTRTARRAPSSSTRAMLDAEIMPVRDAETAEFSKLAETTYRDVNIALANEFARIADALGVDALQAIAAANTQPYSHVHAPGAGVGGHCIPVYPYFLAAPRHRRRRRSIRTSSPPRAASTTAWRTTPSTGWRRARLARRDDGGRAGAGVPRRREGVAAQQRLRARAALTAAGATAYVHDPLYTDEEIRAHGLNPPPSWPLRAPRSSCRPGTSSTPPRPAHVPGPPRHPRPPRRARPRGGRGARPDVRRPRPLTAKHSSRPSVESAQCA